MVHSSDFTTMASLSASVVQPNSRGWVGYLTHEKPSAEDEQPIKKARIESPPPPPPTGVTLPNRRGWVGYFAEVELPPPAVFEAMDVAIISVLAQLHPDTTLSEDAVYTLKQMVRLTCETLVKSLAVGGHATVTAQEMESAVREVFEGELAMVRRCAYGSVNSFHCVQSHHMLPSPQHANTQGMDAVGNSGSTLVFSPEPFSVYLDTVRFKTPGAEVFAPMSFDADSLIYMAFALEYIVVLELAGNASRDEHENIISTRNLIVAVNSDEELRPQGARFGWELLFTPERAIMREEELHLSELKDRIMACDGVVRTLTHLIGFGEGSTVSKDWNTIFENDEKRLLESDEVRCHTKLICTSLYFFTIICY